MYFGVGWKTRWIELTDCTRHTLHNPVVTMAESSTTVLHHCILQSGQDWRLHEVLYCDALQTENCAFCLCTVQYMSLKSAAYTLWPHKKAWLCSDWLSCDTVCCLVSFSTSVSVAKSSFSVPVFVAPVVAIPALIHLPWLKVLLFLAWRSYLGEIVKKVSYRHCLCILVPESSTILSASEESRILKCK